MLRIRRKQKPHFILVNMCLGEVYCIPSTTVGDHSNHGWTKDSDFFAFGCDGFRPTTYKICNSLQFHGSLSDEFCERLIFHGLLPSDEISESVERNRLPLDRDVVLRFIVLNTFSLERRRKIAQRAFSVARRTGNSNCLFWICNFFHIQLRTWIHCSHKTIESVQKLNLN